MTAAEREGRYIIALLRSFLTDADLTDEGEHDWKELYRQTCRHQMVALVYDALQKMVLYCRERWRRSFRKNIGRQCPKIPCLGMNMRALRKPILNKVSI